MNQLRLRFWPGMRLTWVDGCAVVHTGNAPSAGAMAVVASSAATHESSVVVGSHTVRMLPAMIDELADELSRALPRGCARVRMVAWDSGCVIEERPPAAHVLAMRLGLEVLAPAGPLLGVPGGSLFAPFGRGAQRPGGWWRFGPGTVPTRVGWRFPAPVWEADLGDDAELSDDLVLDQVPAGVWLHRPGHRSATDLVYSVPIDPVSPALVLSHPNEAPLRAEELAHAINGLPRRAAERVVLTPYGKEPVVNGRLGEVGATVLGHTVRVRTGLPLCAPAGGRAVVSIDGNGVPRWRPFARELQYAPRRAAPGVVDWANPAPGFLGAQCAPATYDLSSGWVVEVIEPGLWIRPAHLSEPAEWIRALPLDVGRCVVVIGAPHSMEPLPSSQSIAALLEHLPGDARTRVRLIVPRGTPADVLHLASGLRALLPGVSDVLVLGHDEPSTVTTGSIPVISGFAEPPASTTQTNPHGFAPVTPGGPMPSPAAPAPAPSGREVRSHRTAEDKPAKKMPEADRHDTKELQRLLGFFDEIRRAKAWDEDPEWQAEEPDSHQQPATRYH